METTRLGTTDVVTSAVGFGAMHLSLDHRPPAEQGIAVIHRALDLGVTLIDTADAYCRDERDQHHNERLIARALAGYDGDARDVVVATKGGCIRPGGRWETRGDPEYLRRTIRDSHQALGGERPIDLWQHHAPDPRVPIEASLDAVREAVEEGLVRHVGVSNYSLAQIERARERVEVVSVQNQYSPFHRQPEHDGVLDYCRREGLAFLPWSPLGGRGRAGTLGEIPALAAMARERGISCPRLVLAWLLRRSPAILPIPGASRVATLEDAIAAVEVELEAEDVARLDHMFG